MQKIFQDIWVMISHPQYAVFLLTLLSLAIFAKEKTWNIGFKFKTNKLKLLFFGFIAMVAIYLSNHSFDDIINLFFTPDNQNHRKIDLVYEMIQLFLGFEVIEYTVKKSGFDKRLSKVVENITDLMWVVFTLSAAMDNILMSLIGAAILVALFGRKNVPYKLFILVIAAANLGGAFSFIGDTTTIMIYLSGAAGAITLAQAFVGSWFTQKYLNWYAKKGTPKLPKTTKPTPVKWDLLSILFFGIPGIIIGNLIFHQPGIGLAIGIVIGSIVGRVWNHYDFHDILHMLKNGGKGAVFISMLLISADLLPLDLFKNVLNNFSSTAQLFGIGKLSGVFDNIVLTALCISIGGFSWALLAYAAGYGGSFFFFGNSGGIAVATSYEEVGETKKWLKHIPHLIIAYIIGFTALFLYLKYITPMWNDGSIITRLKMISVFLAIYSFVGYVFKLVYVPGLGKARAKIRFIKANWY